MTEDTSTEPVSVKPIKRTRKTTASVKPNYVNQPSPSGRKSGPLNIFLCFTLAIEAGIAGFMYPGFLREKEYDDQWTAPPDHSDIIISHSNVLSSEVEQIPEWPYHSDPIDETPMPGMHLTAEADILYDDTELKITPITETNKYINTLNDELLDEGSFLLSLWETDAGLEPDQVLPGEYQVDLDLDTLEIPENLREDLRVIRVDDNNQITELSSELNGKTLTYRSNQNSTMGLIAIGLATVITVSGTIIFYKAEVKLKEGYYGSGGPSKADADTPYGKFRLKWKMSDMDKNQEEKTQRLGELERKLQEESQQEYDEEQKLQQDTYGSLYWMFNKNKSVAERLKIKKEGNAEYQALAKSILVPENVQPVIERIITAFEYLGDRAMIRIPKHRIEFLIKPKDKDDNLGGVQSTTFHKSYIDLLIPNPSAMTDSDSESVLFRDNLLLTITHELFHICQEGYRYGFADSNRFDEMTAVVLESDAKDYYQLYDKITTDPKLTQHNYWATLVCPIDSYDAGHGIFNKADTHYFMQKQGYLLSDFVQYLRKKTNKNYGVWLIMNTRCSYKKPVISSILSACYELTEEEFDIHFRNWCIQNRERFKASIQEDTDSYILDVQPKTIEIQDNTETHIALNPKGKYSAPIRKITGTTNAAGYIVIPDPDLKTKHPEINILPCENFERLKNGAVFIKPAIRSDGKAGFRNHYFVEVTGNPGNNTSYGDIGYTLWAVTGTAEPKLSEKDGILSVKLPEPVGAAKKGLIDGIRISLQREGGKIFYVPVEKESLGTEVRIDLSQLKEDSVNQNTLKVWLEEYVLTTGSAKLYLPPSKKAELKTSKEEKVWSNIKLEKDPFTGFSFAEHNNDDSDEIYNVDPYPSNNTISISGDQVTVTIGGYEWSAKGYEKDDPKLYANVLIKGGGFTLKGMLQYKSEDTAIYSIIEAPASIQSSANVDGTERETAGNEVTYYTLRANETYKMTDFDLEYDSLTTGSSNITLYLKNGELTSASFILNGKTTYHHTESNGEETYTDDDNRTGWFTYNLFR